MNDKFRASYSVLNTWKSGNWERAIKQYFKLDSFTTEAMADGKAWHNRWEKDIIETKRLPVEFGDKELLNPRPELKIVIQIDTWLEFVCKIDAIDPPTLYEWKTGKESSESYAGEQQIGVYAVACTYPGKLITKVAGKTIEKPWEGVYIDRAELHHYDQYAKKHDVSYVWITDKVLEDSRNWIVSLASEMHSYFVKNSLYERFGPHLALKNGN